MIGRTYLDHAATTPVSPAVLAAMLPFFESANPSSLHAEGRAARAAIDSARSTVARALGAKSREIVFTGGGSEADNLAIVGAARAVRAADGRRHLVSVATEHEAVLRALDVLERDGFSVTLLAVDANGSVDCDAFERALRPETALATMMLANNEIGTLAPVPVLARLARARGVLFHTDAVQAPGFVSLDVAELGVDLLSLSAHKCAGPKGVGALYVRLGTPLESLVVGGGQETGRRAGTENVAGIVGFAVALETALAERATDGPRLAALRDRFEAAVLADIPHARVNGRGAPRLPHISSMAFAGVAAVDLLIRLDLEGYAISTGSACAAGSAEPSHVIEALGAPPWVCAGTIRISLGTSTSEQDVVALTRMLPEAVASIRVGHGDLGTASTGPFANLLEVRS